jgi:hypothetical protein
MMSEQKQQQENQANFHGAAVIDKQGREIPITEDMIKQACEKLEREQKTD